MPTPRVSQQASASPGLPTPSSRGYLRASAAKTNSAYDEEIAGIVDRLQRRYPREVVSGLDLEGRVRGVYRQFDTTHLRTYVAVLVERLVRRSIEEPGAVAVQTRL